MLTTQILSTDHPQALTVAKEIIQEDGLVAFPTDTIYGVAADAFSPSGIQKIYAAKERPQEKALPVLIGTLEQLDELVLFVSDQVRKIAQAFWPGALTLILPKGPHVPPDLSSYPTIGIRMPDLAFTLRLLQETGPLATTSANISGGPNPTTAQDVMNKLGGWVDLILDGGATPGLKASTVIDATTPEFQVLREGLITQADIKALFD